MKITYTNYGTTVSVETESEGIDIMELGTILYNLCLTQSWSPEVLKQIFKKEVINGN